MSWKKTGKNLLYPPLWALILLATVSAGALVAVFVYGYSKHPLGYTVYVLAFYSLTAVCVRVVPKLPEMVRRLRARAENSATGGRYFRDPAFRIRTSLYTSLGINLLYAGLNGILLLFAGSAWFGVLAGYYGILAVMRFLLARHTAKQGLYSNISGQWKRVKVCAVILLTVNFALSGAVLMILYQNKGFNYQGILIYVMAAYTFYITTHAIVGLIRSRKQGSPVMIMSRVIALSAALVSMLALETAMFAQFGDEMPVDEQYLMIVLTGAGVSWAVVTMSVYMILRASRERKKEKERFYG